MINIASVFIISIEGNEGRGWGRGLGRVLQTKYAMQLSIKSVKIDKKLFIDGFLKLKLF